MANILVVDDERSIRELAAIVLKKEGHEVELCESGDIACIRLAQDNFDLVVTDLKMPGKSGMEVLLAAKAADRSTQVILMTAFASTDTAIAAMKEGAADYITKPFKIDELTVQVAKALDVRQLERENIFLKKQLATTRKGVGLVGTSEAMRRVNEMVARVAPAKTTVLITGESGTGKEMFARSIHAQSDRSSRAFIPINCGAIPESLIESELFGHTKGAFTGATGDKKGLFSAAEGGTIFLDEIGELPLPMQVKLLRVLQERKIKRVGSATEETVDARVVAATNRDLRDMVKAGTFREDLFYRLNVIELHLPPLRERRDDIPLLIHHFIAKYAADLGKTIRGVEKDAMQCLLGHPYQGNVRELENIVERAVTLELGEIITRDSLPHGMQEAVRSIEIGGSLEVTEEGVDLEAIVEQLERTLISKALKRASGVRTEAAGLLKISFRSLRYRLQKYGIDGGDIDDPSQPSTENTLMPNPASSRRGFSLVELMIVVSIIGVLASLAAVAWGKQVRKGREVKVNQLFASLATAQETYRSSRGQFAGASAWSPTAVPQSVDAPFTPVDGVFSALGINVPSQSRFAFYVQSGTPADTCGTPPAIGGTSFSSAEACDSVAAGSFYWQLFAVSDQDGDGINARFVLTSGMTEGVPVVVNSAE